MEKKKIGLICIGIIIIFTIILLISGATQNTSTNNNDTVKGYQIKISSDCSWSGSIVNGTTTTTKDGSGNQTFILGDVGIVSCSIQKKSSNGYLKVEIIKDGKVVKSGDTNAEYGVVSIAD